MVDGPYVSVNVLGPESYAGGELLQQPLEARVVLAAG